MDAFNNLTTPATLLATRRSGKARDMVAPGPDAAQLTAILVAAARVPDHGKLAPWRFVVIDDRAAFADLLDSAYRAQKPDPGRLELEANAAFAAQAPCLVVVLSRVDPVSHIPAWEQQLSAGAAIMQLLNAAHAAGFVGNWLTGWAAYSDAVIAALGQPGDRIVGFVFLGSQSRALDERPRPELAAVVSHWP
ncbi:nitroreductase [alpha proteobacterium AAP81b]|nr:nitroreductase [alpha proteobacterium AAP81b]